MRVSIGNVARSVDSRPRRWVRVAGRVTLGLYNSYDPVKFHEAMRRAAVRGGPLATGYGLHLALVGFPWKAFRDAGGAPLASVTPAAVAAALTERSSVGDGGSDLKQLAASGGLHVVSQRDPPFGPQFGTLALATRRPDPARAVTLDSLARRVRDGESFIVLVGLGPRGVPASVREASQLHVDVTGSQTSLETATAMGALCGRLSAALDAAWGQRSPRLAVDCIATRDDQVVLVQRARQPFAGKWALPGGFVEVGETLGEAVRRELLEETGLNGRDLRAVGVYDAPGRDPRGHVVTHVFHARVDGQARAGSDAAQALFHPLPDLPPLAFDHQRILRDFLGPHPSPGGDAKRF